MARIDTMLKKLIEPVSEAVEYCPRLTRKYLELAQLTFQHLQAKEEVDAEAIEQARQSLEAATAAVDEQTIRFRFKHLGETAHDNLRISLDIDMANLRADPARREQARQLILVPLATEPDQVLVDALIQINSEGKQYPTEPDQIAHPERIMQLAAESMRTHEKAIAELAAPATVVDYGEMIERLEVEAGNTDWEPYLKRIGLRLTQQDEAELTLLDDGSPLAEQQIREAKREMYDRAIAVICEANKKALQAFRDEFRDVSRATLESELLNKTLDRMAGRFARTQYINRLLCGMTEAEVDGEWRRVFTDADEVDRLATGKGEAPELYAWLCEQMSECLPQKEAQLVASARFRDDVDNGVEWGQRILA